MSLLARLSFIFVAVFLAAIVRDVQASDGRFRSSPPVLNETRGGSNRAGKLLNLFQIVRFPNAPCNGTSSGSSLVTSSSSKSGICYTDQECASKGGTNEGSCASGFGVCCSFTVGCGQTSSENCTYFDSSAATAGACTVTICPCSSDICQLRLDFLTFSITGPVVQSTTAVKTIAGGLVPSASSFASGVPGTTRTQCLTDTFSVTNPGGNVPPTICGSNTGDHMYVDASQQCNDLTFNLGTAAVGTTLSVRSWSIKISQYSCSYTNLAPDGCTQYFYDTAGTGTIQTYNWDGGIHLAAQNQQICIRQERTSCRICFYATSPADFGTSGTTASAGFIGDSAGCCSYQAGSDKTTGYDCAIIPGASKISTTSNQAQMLPSNFCGTGAGLVTTNKNGDSSSVCTQQTPFRLSFLSDLWEAGGAAGEVPLANPGFMLQYVQDSINCINAN